MVIPSTPVVGISMGEHIAVVTINEQCNVNCFVQTSNVFTIPMYVHAAPLLNADSKTAIPGEYVVILKKGSDCKYYSNYCYCKYCSNYC